LARNLRSKCPILFSVLNLLQVVCTRETIEAADRARKEGRPAWRVSSTVFSQIASDEIMKPIAFATPEALAAYSPVPSGKYVEQELEAINLRTPSPA
jgi:hypothetical protein